MNFSPTYRQPAREDSAVAIEYLKAFVIVLFVYMQVQRGLFRAGLPVGNEFFHLLDSTLNTIILPLAFAVSGWVFACAGTRYSKSANTCSLIDVVVYPYVLWIIIQGFFQTQFNFLTQSNYSFIHIISLLPIEPYGHFEYLYATFFCALLCIVFFRRLSLLFALPSLMLAACVYIYREALDTVTIFSIIAPHLFFFVLGASLSFFKERILSASAVIGAIALLVLISAQWLFHFYFKVDPYALSIRMLFVGAVSISSLIVLFGSFSRGQSKPLITLGKSAFAIYILHFLLVGGTRVLLIDIFAIEHVWLNLIGAFLVAILGGVFAYHYSHYLGTHFLWRAPYFLSTHTWAQKINHLWRTKPISKPMSIGFVILLLSPFAGLYVLSESAINQTYNIRPEPTSIRLSTNAEDIANGKRLAQVYGCYLGCHAPEMQGQVLEDKAFRGRIVAPNLTHAINQYNPDELAVIIRQGLWPDGRALRGWMPTEAYQFLDDQSISDILSFIAAQPQDPRRQKPYRLGWLSRIDLLNDDYKIHHTIAKNMPPLTKTISNGERLARSACGECHGANLAGGDEAPTLQIVKAYSFHDFEKLQRTGFALGNREVGLMSLMARNRFSLLTDQELTELYQFLYEF